MEIDQRKQRYQKIYIISQIYSDSTRYDSVKPKSLKNGNFFFATVVA